MLRTHTAVGWIVLVVASLSAMCVAQPPSQTPPKTEVPEHLRYPNGHLPSSGPRKPGAGRETLGFPQIPMVMDVPEWKEYAQVLKLSGAQRKSLEETYDQYRRSDWDLRKREAQPLYDRSTPLVSGHTKSPAQASEICELFKLADRVGDKVRQIENEFFAQVTLILGDTQLPLLEVVRMRRARKVAQSMWMVINGFRFDLEATLQELDEKEFDLTPREPEVFEGLLQGWRTGITAAYVEGAAQWHQRICDVTVLTAEMVAAQDAGDGERAAQLKQTWMAAKEPDAKALGRIFGLQRQYVQQVAAQLGEPARQRLLETFNERMYGQIFPDPCDLSKFFEAVGELSLSAEQQPAISDVRAEWDIAYAAALQRYVARYESWRQDAFVRGYGDYNYPEYSRDMISACDARFTHAQATIDAVLEELSDKQDKKVAKEVKNWREGVERFRAEQESIRKRFGGWPPPW